ncbi:MAG: DUF4258 domain-containing protein [Hyphomicrobiaceae bacterium]
MTKRPPHPGDLLRSIRKLVEEGRVSYTKHALEDQMPKRGFDIDDVEYVLTTGMIEGEISPGRKASEWSCLVVSKLSLGSRDVGVAAVVIPGHRLIVKTVEWIDP